jgi:hypothetical protein
MAYRRKSQPRPPRKDELQLLASLVDGPKALSSGPVGRCVKKGWCDIVQPASVNGDIEEGRSARITLAGPVLYSLTAKGAQLLTGDHLNAEAAS